MNDKIFNKRIFVVDDDLPSFQLIEELLSRHKVFLKHFTNGRELMKYIKKEELPDMIIMDIQLPGVDGLELTKQVKALEPSIPVIAYTSYAMAGDRERCLQSGCDEYVSKPIDLDVFMEIVYRHIGD